MAEVKNIVRISGTDCPGYKPIERALWSIKGVSFMFASAIRKIMGLPKDKKLGELSNDEINKIQDIINHPLKYGIPSWMLNRRKDIETGNDLHLTGSKIDITLITDIRRMQEVKSYKGIRHAMKLKVRGQRTKSHPRKSGSVGVKKKQQPAKKK